MEWESVIGLEIHVQLATRSKIFSGASTAFGAAPNSQACAVDLAFPGVLPVLNREAVRMAVTFGLAIGAEIARESSFDRKNYFYPDLPKGYQITQFAHPIVGRGDIQLSLPDGSSRKIGITRAHLEEDAGKSLHEDFSGSSGIDLNRAGTPLLEIVSEPDMRTAAEAAAYFRYFHALVRYLGICDGNLNEGSMRCDANVSLRPVGQSELGERTEIKNLNSFRFLERAIEHEIERQQELLEAGKIVTRETRLYDSERDETRSMRSKEYSDDYRYFPEPDLLPVVLEDGLIEKIRAELPELPEQKYQRFLDDLQLSEYQARWLTGDPDMATFFEATVNLSRQPQQTANWIMGNLSAYLNKQDISIQESPVSATQLAHLMSRIADQTISGKAAKQVFDELCQQSPVAEQSTFQVEAAAGELRDRATHVVDEIIEKLGLHQMSNSEEVAALVQQTLEQYPDQVAQIRSGKPKVMGFLVGQVMKASQGKANPKQVNDLIKAALGL